jgi:hypothetical protein
MHDTDGRKVSPKEDTLTSSDRIESAAATPAPPVACQLIGDDLAAQAERWQALRAQAGVERLDVDDGIRIGFRAGPGVEEELRALVAIENGCCSWARWEVVREGASLVMHARSSGDGVAALHGMFIDG